MDTVKLGFAAQDPAEHDIMRTFPVHRLTARSEPNRGSPAVYVGGSLGSLTLDNLRSGVADGTQERARVSQRHVVRLPGNAEVNEDRVSARHHHVAGFEIAVDDAGGVHRSEPRGQPVR